MVCPLASFLSFWIDLYGCLLDIVIIVCNLQKRSVLTPELLFLEDAGICGGFLGINHLLYCYLSWLKGKMGTTMQIALTMMLVLPFLCLIGHEASQAQKLQSCNSQCCLNSYVVLLS